jgi:hypothetical protein
MLLPPWHWLRFEIRCLLNHRDPRAPSDLTSSKNKLIPCAHFWSVCDANFAFKAEGSGREERRKEPMLILGPCHALNVKCVTLVMKLANQKMDLYSWTNKRPPLFDLDHFERC